jgi:hypothetical protein
VYAIVLLIVVATLSLLITRVAAVILSGTGLAQEAARFQARSALSGVGFTTAEAERVVRHPVRRRVIMALMLIGNAGLVTAIAALLGAFLGTGGQTAIFRGVLLVGGLVGLYLIARSRWVDRRMSRFIQRMLRHFTDFDVRDYAQLLHVTDDYGVNELAVEENDWIEGRPLHDLRLNDEGVLVLGVMRADGSYAGAPTRDTVLEAGDTALLYGHEDALQSLSERRRGEDEDHSKHVESNRARQARDRARREQDHTRRHHDPST